MPSVISIAEKRKVQRSFKRRGYVVHPKALDIVVDAYQHGDLTDVASFLEKIFEHLSRPGATHDSIVSAEVASQITSRISSKEPAQDGDPVVATGLEHVFEVIDAFAVPKWRPDSKSAGVQIVRNTAGIAGLPLQKAQLFRERYELVRSKTLRNEQFTPPASRILARGKNPYLQLTGIESLAGTRDDRLVLGMLTQLEEGSWYLEDLHGSIKVDLSNVDTTAGFYTECCFVIAQGRHIESESGESLFKVSVMGMPPRESREDSLATVGKASNLFGGNFDNSDLAALLKVEQEEVGAMILILSDIHLDNPRVVASFRHILEGYLEDEIVPSVIVLIGPFLSHPFGQFSHDLELLITKFTELGKMIADDFESIAASSKFVLVPSLSDPGPGNVLPRPPMSALATNGFVEAIGKERVFLGSNPCRIRYMTQELVFFREDMMYKMKRRCCLKPNTNESDSLPEHLVKTVLDQAHLAPLPLASRPIIWSHDQALWLFPSPHVVVLADEVGSYTCKYGDVVGLNPGSFSSSFSFIVYLPAERKAQQCSLESERAPVDSEEEKLSATDSSEEEGSDVNSLLLGDPRMESEDDVPEPSIFKQPSSILETQEVADDKIGDIVKPANASLHRSEELKVDGSTSALVPVPSDESDQRMNADTGTEHASTKESIAKGCVEISQMEVEETLSATTKVNGSMKQSSDPEEQIEKGKEADVQMEQTGTVDESSTTRMDVDPSKAGPVKSNGDSVGDTFAPKSPMKEGRSLPDKLDEGRDKLKEGEEVETAMSDDK